jgi:hypothetical protein
MVEMVCNYSRLFKPTNIQAYPLNPARVIFEKNHSQRQGERKLGPHEEQHRQVAP